MDTQDALQIFIQLVQEKLNKKIPDIQGILFKVYWENTEDLSFEEINNNILLKNYSPGHIRTSASRLYNIALEICGEKPSIKNFRTIIEPYLKEQEPYLKEQQKSSNQTKTTLSLDFADLMFSVLDQAENRNWYSFQDYRNFAALTQEIANLIKNDEKHHNYQIIARCWKLIKNFTHVYDQHWQQREEILEWLLAGAKNKDEQFLLTETLSELGLTLTLLYPHNQELLLEAESHLEEAQKLGINQEKSLFVDILINQGILLLAQKKPGDALDYLSKTYLYVGKQHPESQLRYSLGNRCLSNLHYYLGECEFELKNWQKADEEYQRSIELAQLIRWQRGEVAANNWQAEIAIQNGDLEPAESLLKNGLKIVSKYKDHRSAGFHCRSLAVLNKEKGDQNQMRYYANQAVNEFLDSNMPVEAEEMKKIRDNLN